MHYLLDMNVISELTKAKRSPSLLGWMAERVDTELFIASLTLAEIQRGIFVLPRGRRRDALEDWFSSESGPQHLFAGRILPFDDKAAPICARMMAKGQVEGRPRSGLDTIIAAVAISNGCIVATGNERDFAGVDIVNPFTADD